MKQPIETEIKLALPSAARGRALLKKTGFEIRERRVLERNFVLDDSGGSLRARGLLLRVRTAGRRVVCTFKGPLLSGRHKSRVEHEFDAGGAEECLAVFAGLGLTESFRYEKYRTEFQRPGEAGQVMLDETPIGVFLELEGLPRWIDRTIARFGLEHDAAITSSYTSLYFAWCAEYNQKPSGMTFPKKNKAG